MDIPSWTPSLPSLERSNDLFASNPLRADSVKLNLGATPDGGVANALLQLRSNTQLTTLHLLRFHCKPSVWEVYRPDVLLNQILGQNPKLTDLSFHGASLQPEQLKALIKTIGLHPQIKELNLSFCTSDPSVISESIASLVENHLSLETLNLSDNNIDDAGIETLIQAFVARQSVQEINLVLEGNFITEKGIERLNALWQERPYIKVYADNQYQPASYWNWGSQLV